MRKSGWVCNKTGTLRAWLLLLFSFAHTKFLQNLLVLIRILISAQVRSEDRKVL